MTRRPLFLAALLAAPFLAAATPRDESRYVVLAGPGEFLFESLPLGNGRLGASLYGGIAEERVVLNENGMWSGSPQEADRRRAQAFVAEVDRQIRQGATALYVTHRREEIPPAIRRILRLGGGRARPGFR